MTQLNTAQLQTLKAAIIADPVLNAIPNDGNGAEQIRIILNGPTNPVVLGWRTDVPLSEILNAIAWDKFTPADNPPAIPATATLNSVCEQLAFMNRLLLIQSKQINLNTMVASAAAFGVLNFGKANVRGGLRDAVIQLLAGTGGNPVSAGGASGVDVLSAGVRTMTKGEHVLKVGQGTTGGIVAQIFGFEGDLSLDDVLDARNS